MDDKLIFAQEDKSKKDLSKYKYKILIVDDDKEIHTMTKLALKNFQYNDKNIEFISSYKGVDVKEVFKKNSDISIVLLDIVMETKTSGLDVIKYIRDELRNKMVRIIIRTGQPGEAPERYVVDNYDINDYKEKTEFTIDKLYITIRTALAQYCQLLELLNKKNEIYKLLITDELTSLPNRNKLNYDIDSKKHKTLMLIDIDRFSLINDAYGFEIGDKVLIHTKEILTKLLRNNRQLYRLESDIFAILITDAKDDLLDDEVLTLKAVINNIPLELGKLSLYINVSIGIVKYQIGNIIQKAEIALRQARKISRNRVEYYHDGLEYISEIEENNLWTNRIAQALKNDNILVYFQPIIDCKTDKVVKFESLVRLRHEGVVYAPSHFLNTARYSGYLNKITCRVFEKACQKFQNNKFTFSINITDHDLSENSFIEYIESTSKKYNIKNSRIVFEILEETSMSKNLIATENLKKIIQLGYSLSIDDFGVQCSNYAQLGMHEYETIKIDGKFIKDIDTNKQSQIITESIIFFTKKIGFKTVAEFVHSKKIYKIVKSMGIDYAQGYYFSEPKPELITSTL